MNIVKQTQQLRAQLCSWAKRPDWELMVRYELLPQKKLPNWPQRFSQKVGRALRIMGLSRTRYRNQKWHSALKHASFQPEARTLLFWAERMEQKKMRDACTRAGCLLQNHPGFVPVLVTDSADFLFYSRLHWLVEYLPHLGQGPDYYNQKRRYLAWRYRDALALPLDAGLVDQKKFDALIAGE